jgi:antirestriction protein
MSVPQIYVASLSDYNAGLLHGEWIEASADADEIRASIAKILRSSAHPNVRKCDLECEFCGHEWAASAANSYACPECTSDEVTASDPYPCAEEWAVHDQEGFGAIELGEHPSLEYVSQLANLLEDLGEAFGAYLSHNSSDDLDSALREYEDAYEGTFTSEVDFAHHCADNGHFGKIPDSLISYIDYQAMARDLFCGDYYTVEGSEGFHVFRVV